MTATGEKRVATLVAGILLGVTLLVYWPAGGYPFISLDDESYVLLNHRVKAGLTVEGAKWAFRTTHLANWHPLTWLSHMADVDLFGFEAAGPHRVNLALHLLNAILLFVAVRRMTGQDWESVAVAALFALHPLHVESVAWISERKDLLSTMFFLLGILAYIWYARNPGVTRYLWVVAAHLLGLLSKPMVVTFPFVLLLLDFWPMGRFQRFAQGFPPSVPGIRERRGTGFLFLEKVPLLAMSAASSWVTYLAQQGGGAVRSFEALPLTDRLGNAVVAWGSYAWKTLWPTTLTIFYPHPGKGLSWESIAVASAFLAGVSVLCFTRIRSEPFLTVGWLWFLGTLVPVIGIVQAGAQGMADRYSYLPLVGLFLMVAWGVSGLACRFHVSRAALGMSAAVVLLALAVQTSRQIRYWRGSEALFSRALEVTSDNFVARQHLGAVLLRAGRTDEAISHLLESVRLEPGNYQSHNLLGIAMARTGQTDEAVAHFARARALFPQDPQAHFQLGMLMAKHGRIAEALDYLEDALRRDPDSTAVRGKLGNLLLEAGRVEEAVARFEETARLDPSNPVARYNLGVALERLGRSKEAVDQYRDAIRLRPGYAAAHNNLGRLFEAAGSVSEAVGQYRTAVGENPKNPVARRNLGRILLSEGNTREAATHLRESLRLDPGHPEILDALKKAERSTR